MFNTIQEYLAALKAELKGSDPAVLQDALADAEEHLSAALAVEQETQPEAEQAQLLAAAIQAYGTPEEIAAAYQTVESFTGPALLGRAAPRKDRGLLARFFGIYADPYAWGSLLYLLILMLTSTLYLTWAVTGFGLSLSFALFIFGLPFVALFLLSVRGIALLEGRIVEALLGIRMPRRPLFSPEYKRWQDRLKFLATDKYTWLALAYMVLSFALATVYFVVFFTLILSGLVFLVMPVAGVAFNMPVIYAGSEVYYMPESLIFASMAGGALLLTITMHLAKLVGGLHGQLVKKMLVVKS